MNKHVAAMLTMLIIPSAFAQTPLTDSKTIVIKPSALAVEMVPDIAYSFTQNIMGRPLQLTMDLLKPYADKPLPAVVFITGGGFLDAGGVLRRQFRQRGEIAVAIVVVQLVAGVQAQGLGATVADRKSVV